MFRLVLAGLLLVHGQIHVLGFVSLWRLARIDPLEGQKRIPVSKNLPKLLGLS